MKNYLVVQNTYSEFLGLYETQLQGRGIAYDYQRPFLGQGLPASVGQYDGLFIMGGASSANDPEKLFYHDDVMRVIQLFRKARRPVIGIGLGGLLIAEAAGGAPCSSPQYSAGFRKAIKTEAGKEDPVAEALDGHDVLVFYHGSVALPEDIQPVLIDDQGQWLAIRPDSSTYGLLFRPEMKPGMLEDILMEEGHNPPPDMSDLLGEARMRWEEMQSIGDLTMIALTKALDLMQERRKMPVFSLRVE